jgi:pSer/pThr/pTyr-binding forkhead associated (FHA) protein
MQAELIGSSGQTPLRATGLTIGRGQDNQYILYDPRVSSHHAVISYLRQGFFTITDTGSTNGTFVNGLRLTPHIPQILHSGDTICLGDTILRFQIREQAQNVFQEHSMSGEKNISWDDSSPTLVQADRPQHVIAPATNRSHRKILLSILLIALIIAGIIAFSFFKYLNRSTPERTLDNFCTALHSKDYQAMYDQLSGSLQALGSVKLIAKNLSNVQNCTYVISKESENTTVAKLIFIGDSGQRISGTIILTKDSNSTWKINDLQNI